MKKLKPHSHSHIDKNSHTQVVISDTEVMMRGKDSH